MAISKLDNKIEDTLASAIVEQEVFEPVQDIPAEPEVDVAQVADTPFGEETAAPVEEPVQIAGLGSVAAKLAKRTKEAEKTVLPPLPDEPVQQVGSSLVIREASPEEIQEINTALGGEYTKGINFPQIAENLGEADLGDYLARLKDANQELFESARRGTLNFDGLMKLAEDQGVDNLVSEWLMRSPGSGEVAEQILGGMLAAKELSRQTKQLFESAKQMPLGEGRDQAMTRAKQMMTMEAQLYANLSGAGSEAGRTLYMLRESQRRLGVDDLGARSDELVKIFGAENAQDVEYLGDLYLALPDARSRTQFVQQGVMSKSMDAAVEVWINSILTAPTTHMVNIAGNSLFMATRQLETMAASGFGAIRGALTGTRNRTYFSESIAQLDGIREAMKDALLVGGRTLLTEEPSDIATKIDVRNRRAIGTTGDPREVVKMIREGNMAAGAVNTFGIMARMGGRFLLAEDEFFKGIAYRSALRRMAKERSSDTYYSSIDAGKTPEEAAALATAEEARILSNPPAGLVGDARDTSRMLTFQGDLDGFLGDLQAPLSHPVAKLFVPFYKTPTNVMKETLKRSPLALAHPSFYRRLAAGGRDADMAMAEVSVGSTIMGTFAYTAMGLDSEDQSVIIMGSGPTNPKAQQAMSRQGLQPFSINLKNEDGTYTSFTYSRLDPISGALAMAADFAYYAQYEEDQAVIDQLAMAATLGISQYAMDMPFLQGVQELTSVFTHPDPKVRVEKFMELSGQKVTEAGLAMLPTVSSFSAGIERMQEPGVGSSMLPEEGIFGEDPTQAPAFARGFYTALQKAKARNPFFSDTVEPKLNLWGEQLTAGSGAGWEFWSPIRVQDTKYAPIDEELMALGGGITRNPKKIDGVRLNAKQYNQWIRTMNQLDDGGKLPGEKGYDISGTMLPQLMELIGSEDYASLPTKDDKLDIINTFVGRYRSAAKRLLLAEDQYLTLKVQSVQ